MFFNVVLIGKPLLIAIQSDNVKSIKIINEIAAIETIAEGHGIRELAQLRERYGYGNWRKKKGIAVVELPNGEIAKAEVHWYEAHGVGKVKRWL